MSPYCTNSPGQVAFASIRRNALKRIRLTATFILAALIFAFTTTAAFADDILIGVIYVCNGERMFADSCNIRDTSDTSRCMIGHPDHIMPNGLMQYTYMTRGELKKLFPTCTQPSAQEVAKAQAFQKRQQDLYNANVAKANQQMQPAAAPAQYGGGGSYGQIAPPKSPEEREMRRCVSSGRLPASCTGNQLLGAFGQMINSMVKITPDPPPPGPNMAGVYVGAGNWRIDFIDDGVLVNCSFLSPNQEKYSIGFKDNRAIITIDTKPKPLVLTLRSNDTMVGPQSPVVIDGVVAGGSSGGSYTAGHTETHQTTTTERINSYEAPSRVNSGDTVTSAGGGMYDATHTTTTSTYVPGTSTPSYTTFVPKRATCPAMNLSTKGATVGIQTMQTDLLKRMFGGDKGPPTPPGIRMHGIFAASTGFSLEFFPESVIVGCGPDAARAYPYTVVADGTKTALEINAPDHPLTFAFKSDGSLDPGSSSAYQVHGRVVTGEDNNDNYTFAPMERACNLAVLTPSKTIPTGGGTAATMVAAAGAPGPAGGGAASGAGLSTPQAPLGNAVLSVVSGFAAQPGVPNPLAGHPYILLRDSYANTISKAGISVPPGESPYKFVGMACASRTPDCQKSMDAVKATAASAVRADANGNGTFPGVPPGTYYLMISTRYNNQPLVWGQAIQVKPGPNSITLDQRNATPLN